jgi:alpha-L-fucosidase 2
MYRILLKYVDPDGMNGERRGGGTYPNLFDAHPPFQIDGNFGGTAGVIEMLMQSTGEKIFLLPALPDAWSEGSVKGICARGGFEVSMEWKDQELVSSTVHARSDGTTTLEYKGQQKEIELEKGQTLEIRW